MNRLEAVSLFKEISNLFQDTNVTSIKLVEPANGKSEGYQVRIKAFFEDDSIRQLRETCKKQQLAVALDNGEVVIYKPKK